METDKLFVDGQTARCNGQIEVAVTKLREAHNQAMKEGDKKLAWECTHMVGVAYLQDEQYEDAREFLQEALAGFEGLRNEMLIGATLRDLAMVARKQKDLERAKELIGQSIDRLGNFPGHLGMSQIKMGMILYEKGKLEEAEDWVKKGLANIKNSPDRIFEVYGLKDLGKIQIQTEKMDEAEKSLQSALQILDEISQPEQNQAIRKKIKDLLGKIKVSIS